ncbi:MAG: phenylalanine--tRNA ligase subunit beta [Oscillospiraceae bacterium]|nr:phenylalanine--tRNA ligase subunit beta [Oscillospiraceae bacterium]
MKLSLKWLGDYVTMGEDAGEYAHRMTMSGSKVEGCESPQDTIKNVVVGRIASIRPHPGADKLVICMVDTGQSEHIQICTAATNLYEGAVIPVALAGAKLVGGLEIKKGKFRGEESNGMLCSIGELGLTKQDFPDADEEGIFIFDTADSQDLTLGQDALPALGLDDTTVEFEITSNRPDCLFVTGLARETAAVFGQKLSITPPKVKYSQSAKTVDDYIDVKVVDKTNCLRYVAMVAENVKIAPSPRWMRERLRASGIRPINNIVDITNYVMLEYNPLHAFDLRNLEGGGIVVRSAQEGEKITALDGSEHILSDDMLMICDKVKPVAIAGVMGGELSGVSDDTTVVVFESACFNGQSVRSTSKKLGLRTDSSQRFEKGLDPSVCETAVMRACELVEMIGAGDIVPGIIDIQTDLPKPAEIEIDYDWVNKLLGTDISREQMTAILCSLGMTVDNNTVTVPTYRGDITHKYDIAEEIARFYGYDNIPSTVIRGTANGSYTPAQTFIRRVNEVMLSAGCNEVCTYSFASVKGFDRIKLPEVCPMRNPVVIENPLGEDTGIMRTLMIPSMLQVVGFNYNNRNLSGRFYESGFVYLPSSGELPQERRVLSIAIYGDDEDFYTLKGIIETLCQELCGKRLTASADYDKPTYHKNRCAALYIVQTRIGTMGEIASEVCESYDIGDRVYLAEIDLEALMEFAADQKRYTPLPKYPAITRDITLLCDERVPGMEIEGIIAESAGKSLENVSFLYDYKGEGIEPGKKSISYSLTFRSQEKTLTDADADSAVAKILKKLSPIAEMRG